MGEDITPQVWLYLQEENTKIAKRILKALDYDIARFIVYNHSVIFIEKVTRYSVIPNYLNDYIDRHNNRILAYVAKMYVVDENHDWRCTCTDCNYEYLEQMKD